MRSKLFQGQCGYFSKWILKGNPKCFLIIPTSHKSARVTLTHLPAGGLGLPRDRLKSIPRLEKTRRIGVIGEEEDWLGVIGVIGGKLATVARCLTRHVA